MNERIEKIIDQAYIELNKESPDRFFGQRTIAKKVAELIVRECVQTLIDNSPERYTNESAEEDWDKGYDRAMKDCVHHIKEHFRVEE